jgi:hypothetical protein
MFSLQAGAIRNALVRAGMPMAAATQISQILSNSAAEYRTGKTTVDSTPSNLKFVDPDSRKHQLTGLDDRADDPDYRTAVQPETEQRVAARRQSDVEENESVYVQSVDYARSFRGDNFVAVQSEGRSVSVGLRLAGGGPYAYMDPQSGTIVGKAFRADVGNEDQDRIHQSILETPFETVWQTQLVNLKPVTVVTVEGQAGGVTQYGTRVLWAWTDEGAGVGADPINGKQNATTSMSVVTDVVWDGAQLIKTTADIKVLDATASGAGVVVGSTECS